jgi:hypothetical protein
MGGWVEGRLARELAIESMEAAKWIKPEPEKPRISTGAVGSQ